jgi:hypothetical protein
MVGTRTLAKEPFMIGTLSWQCRLGGCMCMPQDRRAGRDFDLEERTRAAAVEKEFYCG